MGGSGSNGVTYTEESTVATLMLLIPQWRGTCLCVWPLVLRASQMTLYNIVTSSRDAATESCLCFEIPGIIP